MRERKVLFVRVFIAFVPLDYSQGRNTEPREETR